MRLIWTVMFFTHVLYPIEENIVAPCMNTLRVLHMDTGAISDRDLPIQEQERVLEPSVDGDIYWVIIAFLADCKILHHCIVEYIDPSFSGHSVQEVQEKIYGTLADKQSALKNLRLRYNFLVNIIEASNIRVEHDTRSLPERCRKILKQ